MPLWQQLALMAGVLTIVGTIGLLALDERARRKFASRDDLNRIDEEKDRNEAFIERLYEAHANLESRLTRLEERQLQQWESISRQMDTWARTTESILARLEKLNDAQIKLATLLDSITGQYLKK